MSLREPDFRAAVARQQAFEAECTGSDSNAVVRNGDTIRLYPVVVHKSGRFAILVNEAYYWAETVPGFERFEKIAKNAAEVPTISDDRLELLPRLPGESSFGQLQRSVSAHRAANLRNREPSRQEIMNAPEAVNPRQAALNEAARKNLDQISQSARDRLKARGR